MYTFVPEWKFILTDLFGNTLGEITNADSRQVTLPLNRVPTAGFRIPTSHYLTPYLTNPNYDALLKCYRDSALVFNGPVISAQEASDSTTSKVAVTAASPLWRLNFRLLGNSPGGQDYGTSGSPVSLGLIVAFLLTQANGGGGSSAAYTGISLGTISISGTGAAGTYYFKPVLDALTEIATSATGYDFEAAPVEPTSVGQPWPEIAVLNASNLIGSSKPGVVFEYGTGVGNVQAYSNTITRDGMLNWAYIEQPAATDHSGIITSADSTSLAVRGLFEGLVDNGGVQWDILRTALAAQHVAIRKNPRQIVSFTPAPNTFPRPLLDYIVGDSVRCRVYHDGNQRLDEMLRVYGMQFDIDNQANESVSLTLVSP